MLNSVKGFVVDIDGTIFHGNKLIEGADIALSLLRKENKKIVFLSNRGNISREKCLQKLLQAGIEAKTDEIILSSSVAAKFLKDHYDAAKVWILGEQELRDELILEKVKLADHPTEADWLLISLHEHLTYEDLNQAFQAVQSGARIMATNADKSFPDERGICIDVAGMIGAIEGATNRRVEIVVGKPSWLMADAALKQIGCKAEESMIIGDSLESDISLGKMVGMKTTLVLTGSVKREHITHHKYKPDYILDSVKSLAHLLKN